MLPYQFDEAAAAQICFVKAMAIFGDLDKVLGVLVTYGKHKPAAFGQLIQQRFRDLRRPGGDNDGVEGGFVLPTVGAVAVAGDDVEITQVIEKTAGLHEKRTDPFDGIDAVDDF